MNYSWLCLFASAALAIQPLADTKSRVKALKSIGTDVDVDAFLKNDSRISHETRKFVELADQVYEKELVAGDKLKALNEIKKKRDHATKMLASLAEMEEASYFKQRSPLHRGKYDYPRNLGDKKEVAKKIPFESSFANTSPEVLLSYAKLSKAIYFNDEKRKADVAQVYAQTGLYPPIVSEDLEKFIHAEAPEFSSYRILRVLYRNGSQNSAAMLYDGKKKHLVVVFGGTQSGPDWMHNVSAWGTFGSLSTQVCEGLTVHAGFYKLVSEHLKDVKIALNQVFRELDPDNVLREELKVTVTGHSLGGALSTLMSYVLKTVLLPDVLMPNATVENYSFASPRVFKKDSAVKVEKALGKYNIVRTWNYSDPVPASPYGWMGYKHVGIDVMLESSMYEAADSRFVSHSMTKYIELIQAQYPAFYAALSNVKRYCKQLCELNAQHASLQSLDRDLTDAKKAISRLVLKHGDRIQEDITKEITALEEVKDSCMIAEPYALRLSDYADSISAAQRLAGRRLTSQ